MMTRLCRFCNTQIPLGYTHCSCAEADPALLGREPKYPKTIPSQRTLKIDWKRLCVEALGGDEDNWDPEDWDFVTVMSSNFSINELVKLREAVDRQIKEQI